MPTFSFVKRHLVPGESGGEYTLMVGGTGICYYTHWGFSSCGVDLLHSFKSFGYSPLENNHEELFEWLKENSPQSWKPQEFYMCLSTAQIGCLKKTLKHPCVKLVDRFENKAHGPNYLHLYRVSLGKDFVFQEKK